MKRCAFAVYAVLLLVVGRYVVSGIAAQTPAPCVPSAFAEAQTWLEDARGMSHEHIGGVLPLYQKVSGVVTLPIDLKLHLFNGFIRMLKVDAFFTGRVDGQYVGTGENLVAWRRNVQADTTLFPADGWRMVTFESHGQDNDGKTPLRLARLRGSWDIRNGKPLSTLGPVELQAHAWFSLPAGATSPRGYSNAKMRATSVPTACLSGVWSPMVTAASSVQGQVRNLRVALDPDLHAMPPVFGTTVYEEKNLDGHYRTVNIDTSKLTVGDHKLMIVSDDRDMFQVPVPGTMSGVLVKGFTVAPR